MRSTSLMCASLAAVLLAPPTVAHAKKDGPDHATRASELLGSPLALGGEGEDGGSARLADLVADEDGALVAAVIELVDGDAVRTVGVP